MPSSSRLYLVLVVVTAVAVAGFLFPGIYTSPHLLVPGISSDAGKNMYAYLYHILYGHGSWFQGMNYPYGEHIMFTDAQPLLSVTLATVEGVSIAQAISIMWWFIAVAYILAILYTWRILVWYHVRPLLALLFSVCITVMSPQLCRSLGHFGLSYACVIPMLFYFTLRYHHGGGKKYLLYIFLLSTLATFIHPYFSAVTVIWSAFYSIAYFFTSRADNRTKVRHTLRLLAAVALMAIFTNGIVSATDPITDRPTTPYGVTAYCTMGQHILTSHYSPFWRYLEEHTSAVKNTSEQEGFTYLGLPVILAIVVALCIAVAHRIRKKPIENTSYRIWLIVAIMALALGMGIPFVWNMEGVVQYIPFFRQFRSLGRFTWIFYYVMTIYAAVLLHRYLLLSLARGSKNIAYGTLAAACCLWVWEASGYATQERTSLKSSANNYTLITGNDWSTFLSQHGMHAGDFQSTLMISYYHVGMDKLWLGRAHTDEYIGAMMETGLQLHLPCIDAMMARSSWSITQKQVKIEAGPYVTKPMLADLPNSKPFLLINHKDDALDPDQQFLLDASTFIGDKGSFHVYACYPQRIAQLQAKKSDSVRRLAAQLPVGDTCIGSTAPWSINHFDQPGTAPAFWGTGAMPQINVEDTMIARYTITSKDAPQSYELSCWFLLGSRNYRSPHFKVHYFDASNNELGAEDILTKQSTDNHGLWFRTGKYLQIPGHCSTIQVHLRNEPDNTYELMDELMLRPAGATIISKSANKIMINNHLITP